MLLKIKDIAYKSIQTRRYNLETKKQLDRNYISFLVTFSILIIFILESLSRRSIFKGLGFIITNPLMFLFNVLIVLLTLSFALMFSRRKFLLILFSTLWIGLGVINYIILFNRSTPLTAMDFYLLKSTIGVLPFYLNSFQIILIVVIAVILIVAMIFLWMKLKKNLIQLKKPLIIMCSLSVWMLLLSTIALRGNALANNFGNLPDAYSNYGFAYCFSNSVFNRGISEPNMYSEEQIDEVLDTIKNESVKIDIDNTPGDLELSNPEGSFEIVKNNMEESKSNEFKPNIIMVQLESFFDVNLLLDYTFSENPIPNFTRLKNKYSSGFLSVPTIGAGTVNTEFEIITGMNTDYFGAGEFPYRTILRSTTCESIGYNLDELGYDNYAIHNNSGTFYDRNKVFPKLGFDYFSSIEYMNQAEYNTLGWAKDNVLTNEIFKALKARDTRDFIYAISVQAHGKYPDKVVDESQKIKVIVDPKKRVLLASTKDADTNTSNNTSNDISTDTSAATETNTETDTSIATEANTDTNTSTYASNDISTDTSAATETDTEADPDSNHYNIDKIDIDESYINQFEYYVNQLNESDKFIGELINELSGYSEPTVVVFFGDHLPSLSLEDEDLVNNNKFQTEYILWSNFPMEKEKHDLSAYQLSAYLMERLGYENGVLTKFHQRCIGNTNYQEELKLLQYDMLYGNKNVYGGVNPYIEKTINMGILETSITNLIEMGEALYIYGENFTPSSVAYIDEEPKDTKFINENTLVVDNEKLADKGIYIAQVNDRKIILSKSKHIFRKLID